MDTWFLFALLTVFAWGGSDLFSKMGSKREDIYSHWKMVIAVGFVMGIHAVMQLLTVDEAYSIAHFVKYLPVSLLYILAMVLGYAGLRYLELSVSSPVCNASGAIAMILFLVLMGETMTSLQAVAVTLVCVGVLLLAVFEKVDADKLRTLEKVKPDTKYITGAVAIFLPILYAFIDGVASFLDGLVLDGMYADYGWALSEYEANISYELTFLACALGALFYLLAVKKQKIRLWDERPKFIGALCETAGQFTYVYAMADTPVLAAPMIASYSVMSAILSHIFLKERLSAKYYPVILLVMAGIFILGME